jgi:hypothetical protein
MFPGYRSKSKTKQFNAFINCSVYLFIIGVMLIIGLRLRGGGYNMIYQIWYMVHIWLNINIRRIYDMIRYDTHINPQSARLRVLFVLDDQLIRVQSFIKHLQIKWHDDYNINININTNIISKECGIYYVWFYLLTFFVNI